MNDDAGKIAFSALKKAAFTERLIRYMLQKFA